MTSIPATATTQPTATKTPIPQNILDAQAFAEPILIALPDIPPLFEDDFSYNRGWYRDPQPENASISDGAYHVASAEGWYSFPPTYFYRRDFAIQVDIAAGSNTGMGFFFRMYEGAYYSTADVNLAAGTWRINLGCPGCQDQDGRLGSDVVLSGQAATVLLIVKGQQGALYINSLPAAYFTDVGEYQEGRLGLYCQGETPDVSTPSGAFDNFILWDLWGAPLTPPPV